MFHAHGDPFLQSNRLSIPLPSFLRLRDLSCPISMTYEAVDTEGRKSVPGRDTSLNSNQIGTIGVSVFDATCRMNSCGADRCNSGRMRAAWIPGLSKRPLRLLLLLRVSPHMVESILEHNSSERRFAGQTLRASWLLPSTTDQIPRLRSSCLIFSTFTKRRRHFF